VGLLQALQLAACLTVPGTWYILNVFMLFVVDFVSVIVIVVFIVVVVVVVDLLPSSLLLMFLLMPSFLLFLCHCSCCWC